MHYGRFVLRDVQDSIRIARKSENPLFCSGTEGMHKLIYFILHHQTYQITTLQRGNVQHSRNAVRNQLSVHRYEHGFGLRNFLRIRIDVTI